MIMDCPYIPRLFCQGKPPQSLACGVSLLLLAQTRRPRGAGFSNRQLPGAVLGTAGLRIRDTSGWAALVYLIPIIGFFMWFSSSIQKGTVGNNKYGPEPDL